MKGNQNRYLTYNEVLEILENKWQLASNDIKKENPNRLNGRDYFYAKEFLKIYDDFLDFFKEHSTETFLFVPSRACYESYKKKASEVLFNTRFISLVKYNDDEFAFHCISNIML